MKGIEHLIRMRKAGKRPDTVWINFDQLYRAPKYPSEWRNLELVFEPTVDLRPFIGLDVTLCAAEWNEDIGPLYERLTEYASTITVLIAAFGDDIGWWWDKRYGRTEFGARCYRRELDICHADATHAARMNDAVAYAECTAREIEIIKSKGA